MKVVKRSGIVVDMLFDKVTTRINRLNSAPLNVNPTKVAQKVFSSMYDGISTAEIDTLSAEVAIGLMTEHIDYQTLATRIVVSNLQKMCPKKFTEAMMNIFSVGGLSEGFMECLLPEMNDWIVPERDYDFEYFGIKTLQKGYLHVGETPQYMFMRVAIGIHGTDYERVKETYTLMSKRFFTHASPTLFNAGSKRAQMSSCFLLDMKDDSIDGIYDTMKECAQISKWSGGIGLAVSKVRSKGSRIVGTNGTADGIVPMLRCFNATARYVNQGGHRKGAVAVYLEPWHADVMEFLELRLNQGDEEARCRDLFTALWIPDLFMARVSEDLEWHLMCPSESPGLTEVCGDDFLFLYNKYVAEGKYRKKVRARDVWNAILKSQIETGTPYMLYKDSINAKSNQKNLGVIKCSNLCTEIVEYSSPDETAVCNLASLSLPAFVTGDDMDYDQLEKVTRVVTRNLNQIIDRNFYPTETARKSNMRHRPIAIGVQGLADVFMMMGIPFDSPRARELNTNIFKSIYRAALTESCALAKLKGPYETFKGSPAWLGILQPDMWNSVSDPAWNSLKDEIIQHGLRNSLLVAPMPTASTAQILGNNEAFEPYTTNLYIRRTLAGEFVMVNKHLVRELTKLGLWNTDIKTQIVRDGGSVQNLDIPDNLKEIFRTVWEIPQKSLIEMSADRGVYIDQTQSLNLFMENPSVAKLSSMHFYGWRKGLKTGMYYLRTRAKATPVQVTVPVLACSMAEGCQSCSG